MIPDDFKVPQEMLGSAYLYSTILIFMALLGGSWVIGVMSLAAIVWTFLSDTDEENHIDPPGTMYMDRNGNPVAGAEGERL